MASCGEGDRGGDGADAVAGRGAWPKHSRPEARSARAAARERDAEGPVPNWGGERHVGWTTDIATGEAARAQRATRR